MQLLPALILCEAFLKKPFAIASAVICILCMEFFAVFIIWIKLSF